MDRSLEFASGDQPKVDDFVENGDASFHLETNSMSMYEKIIICIRLNSLDLFSLLKMAAK